MRMPGGRPSKIDQVVRRTAAGAEVTAADEVIERVRIGCDLADAADSANIDRKTLHTWRLGGARALAKHAGGGRLTAKENRLVEFLHALERAEAEAELTRLGVLERATRPQQVTKVVERVKVNADGSTTLLERTTTTQTVPGQWQPAAWWLERRMPGKYARRLEVTGAGGTPLLSTEQRAATLADEARSFLEAQEVAPDVEHVDAGS